MRRRRFMGMTAGLTGAVGLSATATACGGDSGGGDVTLKFVVMDLTGLVGGPSVEHYWNDLVTEFRKENPEIGVEVIAIPYQQTYSEVVSMVERGEAPDIAQLYMFAEFAHQGALYNANEILSIPALTDFPASIAEAGEVRRVQYGMPYVATVHSFFYNKSLFDQAGLDPDSPPTNWSDLLDAASALRTAGVKYPYGLPLGHEEAAAEAVMWILAGGGSLTDPAGTYTLDSALNVSTFSWLRDELVGQGLAGSTRPAGLSRQLIYEEFAAGRVGMLTGDAFLMGGADQEGIEYGVTSLPGRRGSSLSAVGDASWLLGFKQRGNGEAIAAFLHYIFSEYENIGAFAEQFQLLPVSTPAAQQMSASSAPEHQRLRPFLDELPSATFFPAGKRSWTDVSALIARSIGEAVQPGADVEAVLGQLQTEADGLDQAGA